MTDRHPTTPTHDHDVVEFDSPESGTVPFPRLSENTIPDPDAGTPSFDLLQNASVLAAAVPN
jgi:hypothetical protein